MSLISAITIGFLGSFHCVGMCGPIFLSLPGDIHPVLKATVYSLGRSITYAVLGLIVGWLGFLFSMGGYQAPLSIFMGVLVLLFTFLHLSGTRLLRRQNPIRQMYERAKESFVALFRNLAKRSLFVVGLVNGFLPCAFVYAGLGSAVTTGDPISSAAYMALFGLGTLPAMIGVALAGRFMGLQFRRKINRALPAFAIILGIILIVRGLSLNIPFLSPDVNEIIFGNCEFN